MWAKTLSSGFASPLTMSITGALDGRRLARPGVADATMDRASGFLRRTSIFHVALPVMLGTTLVFGCSLMALEGLSDGDPTALDGAPPDRPAPGDLPEAGAPSDGAPSDAGLVDAGGGDAEAGAAPFCASLSPAPTVCLDFDSVPPFGSWVVVAKNGGAVEPSSEAFTSPPRAARFSRDPAGGVGGVMVLRYALAGAGAPEQIVLEAKVRIEQTASDDELDLMTVIFPVGSGGDTIELQFGAWDGLYRFEKWSFFGDGGSGGTATSFQRAVALGKWQHLRLTLDLSAGKARLEIDGAPAPEVGFTLPSGLGAPILELGDGYLEGDASAFFLDDFTATLK